MIHGGVPTPSAGEILMLEIMEPSTGDALLSSNGKECLAPEDDSCTGAWISAGYLDSRQYRVDNVRAPFSSNHRRYLPARNTI
jgi:hypothetical protein